MEVKVNILLIWLSTVLMIVGVYFAVFASLISAVLCTSKQAPCLFFKLGLAILTVAVGIRCWVVTPW